MDIMDVIHILESNIGKVQTTKVLALLLSMNKDNPTLHEYISENIADYHICPYCGNKSELINTGDKVYFRCDYCDSKYVLD